jgi:S-DNA-T family DNA segregation ATPase FtsK/SpoIIIE
MSRKHKKKNRNRKKAEEYDDDEYEDEKGGSLSEETLRVIYAILFFIAALVLTLSSVNKAGPIGVQVYEILGSLLGVGYFLLPIILCALGIIFLKSLKQSVGWLKVTSSFVFLLAALGIISILMKNPDGTGKGGIIGNIISSPLVHYFDFWVTLIILTGIIIISVIITLDTHLSWERLAFWRKTEDELDGLDEQKPTIVEEPKKEPIVAEKMAVPELATEVGQEKKEPKKFFGFGGEDKKESFQVAATRFLGKTYTPPPLSLLNEDKGKPGVGDIKGNANIIKRTLQNFGINVEMDEISIGPSVTRYALKPAEGVKLSKIVGLQNDLALALAAHPIRIEAPIPGKSLVGIEIPNTTKTTVGLGTLLGTEEFQHSDKPLLIALGRGVSGKSHFSNLAKMPHLLIAGATGSGKSVTIHAILASLLYRNSPENLKFIMIDPKRVELTSYNNIPHLLTPVITDAKKSILALKWTAKEMDRRYDILESEKVRDIESYHKNILAPALKRYENKKSGDDIPMPETMPYIVIIIDELADLMQAYPRELESSIVRLAQMSRAVGIHLMLSTQRPSVNVITGLIKANVPSRIALQVTSQIDSRTILDSGGAEKLLGAGDMLFMSGDMSKPQRLQSAYISETEVKSIVKYLVDAYADELPNEISLTESSMDKNEIFSSSFDDNDGDNDDLYEEAKDIVVKAGKASTSYLQRKLRVGYGRAARLIDMLEERGVIGPGSGARPREVINGGEGAPESTGDDTIEEL